MNLLDDVHSAYESLRNHYGLPSMEKGSLHRCEPQHFQDEAALWDALFQLAPESGWLCFQSAVAAFRHGQMERGNPEDGRLLHGEAVTGKGDSLRIRPDGHGGWWLDVFTATDGEPCLVDDVELVRRDRPGRLRYRRYWRHDEFHGVCQFAACFIGFSEDE